MSYQIPPDDPIWDLTPTELNVAYLSLTLKKGEIATRLQMGESTVGTHLTNIFSALGLTGIPDEDKRPLLKQRYGRTIERLVSEVQEDYEGEYKKRRKEALAKRDELRRQQQSVRVPTDPSGMDETPPAPRARFPIPLGALGGRDFLVLAIGFVAGIIVGGVLFGGGGLRPTDGDPTAISTHTVSSNLPPSRTPTSNVSPTPENTATPEISPTPENTATPEITLTPVPLPIREDFNERISPLWTESGDPVFVGGTRYRDGVFTTRADTMASLSIGNTAWKDLIITTRADTVGGNQLIEFSVRVVNINQRIILSCKSEICSWIVVFEGERDVVQADTDRTLDFGGDMTIVVQGDKISVTSGIGSPYQKTTQLVIPTKYQGHFDSGGVIFEIGDIEVDFIEIQQFR